VDVSATFRTVRANGMSFEVLEAGAGERLALCLHGFPEHAIAWTHQLPALVGAGYRVWAPNQRGYGRTTRPPGVSAYGMPHLLDDVAALIDASGARSVTLLGHDWGAAVTWFFAMRRVRPLERLVIMNVPHPAAFAHALRTSWRQRLRSWYIAFFQIPFVPELVLRRDHARPIVDAFLRTAAHPERFTADELETYRAQADEPGALRAMLAWYRAAARTLPALIDESPEPIDVPTLMLWGEDDFALGTETTYGTDRYVRDLRLIVLPGVSHWLQQDATERVNAELVAFLGSASARA
jgi:pimeloyl-ACP methyl ester carboxylesterase